MLTMCRQHFRLCANNNLVLKHIDLLGRGAYKQLPGEKAREVDMDNNEDSHMKSSMMEEDTIGDALKRARKFLEAGNKDACHIVGMIAAHRRCNIPTGMSMFR